MSRCPACGSAALVEDAHYAQRQLVCAACGCVLDEGLLTTTYGDEERLREVAFAQSTGQREQQSRCVQRGVKRVRDLCKVLQLPRALEEAAAALAERALRRPALRRRGRDAKELLGGCCVLAASRQHGWPLTAGTVCALLYAGAERFAAVYRGLQSELQLCVPALGLADLVRSHLNSFRLLQPAADVPPQFVEDKEQLVARTLQVVELAGETWLVTGRHPVPVVTAAAFLAWQSLRPAARLACSLRRFCRLAGVDVPPPARLRLQELHGVLLRMAAQLAWLRVLKVDKATAVKHLGDLLQHRVYLLKKAFRAQDEGEPPAGAPRDAGEDEEEQDSPSEQEQDGPSEQEREQDSPSEQEQDGPSEQEREQDSPLEQDHPSEREQDGPSEREQDRPLERHGPSEQEQGHPSDQRSPSEREQEQRPPLLPPCLLKPRKRLRTAAPSAAELAVTGDEPISDGEIEQYLRDREEARAFAKAKAWE